MHSDFTYSTHLQALLDRLQAGEDAARAALLEHALGRIQALGRKMFRGRRDLHLLEGTDDVVQKALLRLHKALETVQPRTVRAFFGLASRQLRFVILDLAKRFRERRDQVPQPLPLSASAVPGQGEDQPATAAADLDRWARFHEAIQALPDELREPFDLLFYQELTHPEAAGVLGISERTLRRRWQHARLQVAETLRGEWPEPS
jgi:RNA polymerase sigma-70 factor (ECF subfamily)